MRGTILFFLALPLFTACTGMSSLATQASNSSTLSSIDSSSGSTNGQTNGQINGQPNSATSGSDSNGGSNSGNGSDTSSNSGSGSGSSTTTSSSSSITVMAMGDSNTYGTVAQSYREALSNYMSANALPIQFVGSQTDLRDAFTNNAHEGYSGWAAEDLLNGMSGLYPMNSITKYKPQFLLLMAGTNDIFVKKYGAAQATQNVQNLVAEIQRRSPSTKIILATPFPIVNAQVNPRQGYPGLNDQISGLVSNLKGIYPTSFGSGNVMLLDMNSFVDFDWLSDGVHATALGYVAVAQAWYSVLAPNVATFRGVSQPACMASPASRSYIMTSLRYMAAAYADSRLSTDAATFTQNINTGIGVLIQTNWACTDTTNVANYVTSAVAYISAKAQQ